MDLAHAGLAHQVSGVALIHPPAGHDHDPPLGLPPQRGDDFPPLPRRLPLPRGQDSVDSKVDERLQRDDRIGADIEGAVECDRQIPRGLLEDHHRVDVDVAMVGEGADDDPVAAHLASVDDIEAHHREFGRAIDKAAAAEPDDRKDRDIERGERRDHRPVGGGGARVGEIVAELDPVGPARLGVDRGLYGVDAGFD